MAAKNQEQKQADLIKENKDQRLTLAIRKSAMQDLKNLASLKQTTLNNYVNQLVEADIKQNRAVLDAFKQFTNKVQ